jgi:hypothetical protein
VPPYLLAGSLPQPLPHDDGYDDRGSLPRDHLSILPTVIRAAAVPEDSGRVLRWLSQRPEPHQHASASYALGGLRARWERLGRRRAAEDSNELAPFPVEHGLLPLRQGSFAPEPSRGAGRIGPELSNSGRKRQRLVPRGDQQALADVSFDVPSNEGTST